MRVKLYKELRAVMSKHDITQAILARHLLVSTRTIAARLADEPGQAWTLPEMYATMELLNLPFDQLHVYFPPGGIAVKPEKAGSRSTRKAYSEPQVFYGEDGAPAMVMCNGRLFAAANGLQDGFMMMGE